MKKILFVCLMAALGLGTGSAAAKDAKKASTVTTVFKTDIDCEHCAKRIMDNIPFEKGVKDVKVDVPSKEVTVVYDASKNDAEGLVKGFRQNPREGRGLRREVLPRDRLQGKLLPKSRLQGNCCKKGDCDRNAAPPLATKKPLATRSARTAPRRRSSPATNPNGRDVRTFRLTAKKKTDSKMLSVFSFLWPNHSPGMDSSGSAALFSALKATRCTGPRAPAASTATLTIT